MSQVVVDTLRPGVRSQPVVGHALLSGVTRIVDAVRPTLGPTPRLVAVARATGGAPELLDSGATIARRIVALPDQAANTGAMLARALIWQMHEAVGDGTVTAAVMYAAAVRAGFPFLAAGGDPWAFRAALAVLGEELHAAILAQARPITGKVALTRLARHLCLDDELAPLLGEIVDIVGADGQVEIHAAPGRRCEREYAEGMHWPSGVASAQFITDLAARRVTLTDAGLLITDFDVTAADVPVILAQARRAGLPGVVIAGQRFADGAIAALLHDPLPAYAVKLPGAGETARMLAQHDLALLTGGLVLTRAAGDTGAQVTPVSFGRARLLWADRDRFGLIGGQGDPRALRRQITSLRAQLDTPLAAEPRQRLQTRLGDLLSGSATLTIGGATASAIATRRERAQRAVQVLRGAVAGGVVPGGGAALLACRPALSARLAGATTDAERMALRAALAALAAPTRTILGNAGHEPAVILADLAAAPPGSAFDVVAGRIVDCGDTGLHDAARVTAAAVRLALSAAGQALTIETVVTGRAPATATTPLA